MVKLEGSIPITASPVGVLSINRLYINRRQGGRALSPEGKAFKSRTMFSLAKQWSLLNTEMKPNTPYKLTLTFYFDKIVNSGYGVTTKTKFKKVDAYNFGKMIQDCVAEATGVDDSNHLDVEVKKRCDQHNPRVDILLEEIRDVF